MKENRVTVLLVCLLAIISITALVLGVLGLTKSNGAGTGGAQPINIYTPGSSGAVTSDEKIWMIAIGHYGSNVEYLDEETYTIRGFNPDILDAVCAIANKNCKLVYDVYGNCWDSNAGQRPRGGQGLMGGWYDGCSGWIQTFDRLLTYSFTKPYMEASKVAIYAKNGSTLPYDDLTNRKVGFADGWAYDEFCLARYTDIEGSRLAQGQIIHFASADRLVEALNNGEVDVIFVSALGQYEEDTTLMKITPPDFDNKCLKGGNSIMTRHNNPDFVIWWNDAFDLLVQRGRYDEICKTVSERHGHIPGRDYTELCIGY
ncbi:uncharacterized protein LOC105442906 isoform X2 [Strongylocentrotus purpuratus]|uniref:Solute-binding protein family 3/N-terminal domain-containing protein n=1 Tax=Strongylocentrotus purpuratus TaxID=7668 RepID=A0A7M7GH27_STRPU|nr:uncharacterized protein LOC756858 isoform X2 [Strongylocentrotus purpuratus]XP_030849337.1 uncharacterized protein LOC105442906 isoform X2 [Strongylocentrotus purpuratus]|eukprot:XP_003728506.1 PREDICTED: uncharacterized protein LOC756858 isoform X2 [Strongylocentrotus purpuratus]